MTQTQRIAIVTGANRGIGLEVVRQLAQKDMTKDIGSVGSTNIVQLFINSLCHLK